MINQSVYNLEEIKEIEDSNLHSIVRYQLPDEDVNNESSLIFISNFIDYIKNKNIQVVKERHSLIRTSSDSGEYSDSPHDPFEFKLKSYKELSNHNCSIEFSIDSYIQYNKKKFYLKGYLTKKLYEHFQTSSRPKKQYLFDIYETMFSIYLPDKSIIIFNLKDPPVIILGCLYIQIDYRDYNLYT